jgi:hypothetical protein
MKLAAVCLAALLAWPIATHPALADADLTSPAALTRLAQGSFPEYLRFLAMPSDAVVPADIQKNAAFVEDMFRRRGFTTRLLPNNGKPLVAAEFDHHVPGARTVLFYMHLDAQPVTRGVRSSRSATPAANGRRSRRICCSRRSSIPNCGCSPAAPPTTRRRS